MNKERATKIINGFVSKRILVIGDVVLDHYIHGVVERFNPEATAPLLDIQHETSSTGGAGNVAKNVVGLGSQATLISVIGKDSTAEEIQQASHQEGYNLIILTDDARPTPRKTRFLFGSQQLLRVDREVKKDVSAEHQKELIKLIDKHTSDVDAILVSDYAKGVITSEVATAILEIAKKHNLPVAVDAKPSRLGYFKGATFMSPNRKEAREALHISEKDSINPVELVQKFSKAFNTTACITLSADGMIVAGPDQESLHVPQIHKPPVFDVSGAGDTAIVTLLLSRLSGATWEEALVLANAAGAVVVAKVGTVGLTSTELQAMISHEHD